MYKHFIMKYTDKGNDIETGIVGISIMTVPSTSFEADNEVFNTVVRLLDIKPNDKVGIFEVIDDNVTAIKVVRTANPYMEKDKYVYKYETLSFPRLSNAVKLVEDLNPNMFAKHGLYRSKVLNKLYNDYGILRYREPIDSYRFEITHGVKKENIFRKILKFYKDVFL